MDILFYIGAAISILGALGFLLAAFSESALWGLGCLFISPVSLFFLFMHWDRAKNPFLLEMLGVVIMVVAMVLGAGAGSTQPI